MEIIHKVQFSSVGRKVIICVELFLHNELSIMLKSVNTYVFHAYEDALKFNLSLLSVQLSNRIAVHCHRGG